VVCVPQVYAHPEAPHGEFERWRRESTWRGAMAIRDSANLRWRRRPSFVTQETKVASPGRWDATDTFWSCHVV